MAVTIKDVAREAGVSTATVSKVINKSPTISQTTINNVHAVMKRLEYVPNQLAANLSRASSKNIAFLARLHKGKVYGNPHMFEIICGAQNELERIGYTLTLVDISHEERDGEKAKKIILQKSSDGIIIQGEPLNISTADFFVKKEFPHIVIGKPDFEHRVSWIDVNHVLVGEIAAQHLFQYGYSRISCICGREEDVMASSHLRGMQSFLNSRGTEIDEQCLFRTNHDINEINKAVIALLNMKNLPDAIVCGSNLIAVGVCKVLEDKKISVPSDMGVIMIDDYPYSQIITPTPTVVNIDLYDLGVQSVKSLMRKIKNPTLQVQTYTTLPELINRETTKQM